MSAVLRHAGVAGVTGKVIRKGIRGALVACALALLGAAVEPAAGAAAGAATAAAQDPQRLIVEFLRQQAGQRADALQVQVDLGQITRRGPCTKMEVVKQPYFRLRPRMSVAVQCFAPAHWTAYARVTASLPGNYPVAANRLEAGVDIAPEFLRMTSGDLLELPADVVLDVAALTGRNLKVQVAAGRPVRTSDLRVPGSVRKGTSVRLQYIGKGFEVTREGGVALADGAPGQAIPVKISSGQIITGFVRDPTLVEVAAPGHDD